MLGMKHNVGPTDRTARLVLGLALAVVGLAGLAGAVDFAQVVVALALVVGAVLVGTALTRVCLVYRLVGADTCRRQ